MGTVIPPDQKNRMAPEPVVVKAVEIRASTKDVWRALTDPDQITQWVGGTQVAATWKVGSPITFSGTMPNFNKKYSDRGTVLAMEPEKFLQYSHWSEMSRLQTRRTTVPSLHLFLILSKKQHV